jgi:hypothetical protein
MLKLFKNQCEPAREGQEYHTTCFTLKELTSMAKELNIDINASSSDMTGNGGKKSKPTKQEIHDMLTTALKTEKGNDVELMKHRKLSHLFEDGTVIRPEAPEKYLSNFDIDNNLKQWERAYPYFHSFGATPYNFFDGYWGCNVCSDLKNFDVEKFQKNGKKCWALIVNLDCSNSGGSHWVTLFYKRVGKTRAKLTYFDSLGPRQEVLDSTGKSIKMTDDKYPIPFEIKRFADDIIKKASKHGVKVNFTWNKRRHQMENSECGMYSLYYTINCIRGKRYIDSGMPIPDKQMEIFRHLIFQSPLYCWKHKTFSKKLLE